MENVKYVYGNIGSIEGIPYERNERNRENPKVYVRVGKSLYEFNDRKGVISPDMMGKPWVIT